MDLYHFLYMRCGILGNGTFDRMGAKGLEKTIGRGSRAWYLLLGCIHCNPCVRSFDCGIFESEGDYIADSEREEG